MIPWRGVIEEYRSFLPVSATTPVVTLLEGGTPLLTAPRLSERVGANVLLKLEGANPTGSFKDRGMTMAISKAAEEGVKAVVCASTGNTSASAAAYAARAGMSCSVLIGDAPEVHCIPVGNAGNITAYWRGYCEYRNAGRSTRLPRMLGFQAAGAAPIVAGHPIAEPETIATAIRIGNPASWYGATAAASESGGGIFAVTDEEILDAYRFLATEESVFCEAASAASVAGLLKAPVVKGSTVVCVLTGHGLKDPDLAISQASVPPVVDADLGSVLGALGL